jgi:hypothetical protein
VAQGFVWYVEIAESPGTTAEEDADGADGESENHEKKDTGKEAHVM